MVLDVVGFNNFAKMISWSRNCLLSGHSHARQSRTLDPIMCQSIHYYIISPICILVLSCYLCFNCIRGPFTWFPAQASDGSLCSSCVLRVYNAKCSINLFPSSLYLTSPCLYQFRLNTFPYSRKECFRLQARCDQLKVMERLKIKYIFPTLKVVMHPRSLRVGLSERGSLRLLHSLLCQRSS